MQAYLDQVNERRKISEEEKVDYFKIKQEYIHHLKEIADAHGIVIDKDDLLPFQVRTQLKCQEPGAFQRYKKNRLHLLHDHEQRALEQKRLQKPYLQVLQECQMNEMLPPDSPYKQPTNYFKFKEYQSREDELSSNKIPIVFDDAKVEPVKLINAELNNHARSALNTSQQQHRPKNSSIFDKSKPLVSRNFFANKKASAPELQNTEMFHNRRVGKSQQCGRTRNYGLTDDNSSVYIHKNLGVESPAISNHGSRQNIRQSQQNRRNFKIDNFIKQSNMSTKSTKFTAKHCGSTCYSAMNSRLENVKKQHPDSQSLKNKFAKPRPSKVSDSDIQALIKKYPISKQYGVETQPEEFTVLRRNSLRGNSFRKDSIKISRHKFTHGPKMFSQNINDTQKLSKACRNIAVDIHRSLNDTELKIGIQKVLDYEN